MKTIRLHSLLALAIVLGGCGGEDARHVRVELDFAVAECSPDTQDESTCTVHLRGSGIVVRADDADDVASEDGQSTLYAEVTAPNGSLAMIEIAYGARGPTQIRYREVADGMLLFDGKIASPVVNMPEADGYWFERGEFSFRATEVRDQAGMQDNLRIIKNGRVYPLNPDQVRVNSTYVDDDPVYGHRGSTHVVIVIDDTNHGYYDDSSGCEGDSIEDPPSDPNGGGGGYEPTTPDYPPSSDDGCEGDGSSSSSSSSSDGCGGDSSSSSSSDDGCDSGSSSSSSGGGCEGDSSSSSDGCDSGSSSSSSSSSCDGCEGDAYAGTTIATKRGVRSPASSMFRLIWPIAIVGYVNRRQRRRSRD